MLKHCCGGRMEIGGLGFKESQGKVLCENFFYYRFHFSQRKPCKEKFTRRMLDDFYDILTRSKTLSQPPTMGLIKKGRGAEQGRLNLPKAKQVYTHISSTLWLQILLQIVLVN